MGYNYLIHSKAAFTLSSAIGRFRSRVVKALEYSVHTGFAQIRLKCLAGQVCIWGGGVACRDKVLDGAYMRGVSSGVDVQGDDVCSGKLGPDGLFYGPCSCEQHK